MNYVVKELDRKFQVLIEKEVACGFLWRNRETRGFQCNEVGSELQSRIDWRDERAVTKKLKLFDTLEQALDQIDRFTPKYHRPENMYEKPPVVFCDIELRAIAHDVLSALSNEQMTMNDRIIRQDILRNIQDHT